MAAPGYQLSPPAYYRDLGTDIEQRILNVDNPSDFKFASSSLHDAKAQNFLLDFSDDEAWCGFNLHGQQIERLLRTNRPAELNTRWINIWQPQQQKDLLDALARHYDFSPRLLGLMCSPALHKAHRPGSPESKSSSSKSLLTRLWNRNGSTGRTSPENTRASDIESGYATSPNGVAYRRLNNLDVNQYVIADALYYYASMDWGRRYVCIGYNTLHDFGNRRGDILEGRHDKPAGLRVWNWLLLTEDKTIITVQEDVFDACQRPLTYQDQAALIAVRRNVTSIFSQCSKASNLSASMRLPIRHRIGDSTEETAHRSTDVPGLLFYYLFADELNTYSLIARREQGYSKALENLRQCMMERADLAHIERLHVIGKHLSVLRRMYEGYISLIDRLLEPRMPTLASLKNSAIASGECSNLGDSGGLQRDFHTTEEHSIGVSLSSAARVRLERLRGTIALYAVREIEECQRVTEGLVMMNFNLIAIKESHSVERLTRITLLLAKLTFLFMPVSVVTGYFGCQFVDARFTIRDYWGWFAGSMGASVVLLVVFGALSGTMEAEMVYRSVGAKVVELIKCLFQTGRTEKEE